MRRTIVGLVLAALVSVVAARGDAQEASLPEGLRPAGTADVQGRTVQLFRWRLPDDGGELELVHVPAGAFRTGDDAEERTVGAFWVARHEVTRGAFLAFCAATGATPPPAPPGAGDRHPVADVTWHEARAFCAWAGLALPTELEWEKAARGTDGRAYPWGDDEEQVRSNSCDATCPEDWPWKEARVRDGHAYTAPVGSFPAGASPWGALDMAGNVWEWCADDLGDVRVARGGGWCSPRVTGRTTARNAFEPEARWAGLGLRPVLRERS